MKIVNFKVYPSMCNAIVGFLVNIILYMAIVSFYILILPILWFVPIQILLTYIGAIFEDLLKVINGYINGMNYYEE